MGDSKSIPGGAGRTVKVDSKGGKTYSPLRPGDVDAQMEKNKESFFTPVLNDTAVSDARSASQEERSRRIDAVAKAKGGSIRGWGKASGGRKAKFL